MLVSYLWLKDMVDISLSPEQAARALTSLGLETCIPDDRRGWYKNLVTGKTLEVKAHPRADRLNIVKVDVGQSIAELVCGAPNVAVGQCVAVALPGAVLPGGMVVEKREIRGVSSAGMICSEAELRLSDNHDGIMILDDDPAPGLKFGERYEVCDVILEVDLTPNRGDCLSMTGIAREMAAFTGAPMRLPAVSLDEVSSEQADLPLEIEIQAPGLCPRYAGRVVTRLAVGPSPFWMRRRLSALGIRSINNLVDVTNYVLLETGHPLHAFDYSMIEGNRIVVRTAFEGERFVTLDGNERELDPENLVITDAKKALALAGIMGGENSEVTPATTQVMVESAFFSPVSIRKTARQLNMTSESSFRFERGTDIEGLIHAQDRAVELMARLGGGLVAPKRVDIYPAPQPKRKVTIRYARTDKILGLSTAPERVKQILTRLEMDIVSQDDESVTVTPPAFRFDIEREIDLVEEVARFVGYDKIAPVIPRVSAGAEGISRSLELRRAIRGHLRSIGMMEGLLYSFSSRADMDKLLLPQEHPLRDMVKIDNPLSSEWTHLRSTIIPGLVSSAPETDEAMFYEIGVVFRDMGGADAPEERWMVSGMITENMRPGLWSGKSGKRDFYHVKGVVESLLAHTGYKRMEIKPSAYPFYYPRRQAQVSVEGAAVGHFGQAHPDTLRAYEISQELFVFELAINVLADLTPPAISSHALCRYPSVKRDLAVVVDDSAVSADLARSIQEHGGNTVSQVALFDVYSGDKIGPGKKSLAFSLEFRDDEKTLTDEEVNSTFERILCGLKGDFDAHLR